jgi:outer membrane protein insertion porin family
VTAGQGGLLKGIPPIFFRICALFIFLLAGIPSWAQISMEGLPIKRIEVRSKLTLTAEDLHEMAGIKAGDRYSSQSVRKSLTLLYQTGLFRDIGVETDIEEGGVIVRYIFIERILVSKVSIRGNWKFRDRTLKEHLGIQPNEEFTEEKLKKALSDLMDFYHDHGYFQARSTTDVVPTQEPNRVLIEVRLREGTRARIEKMSFVGEKVFSDLRLWSIVRSQSGEYYRTDQMERDLAALDAFYRSRGYHQASIGPPIVLYSSENHTVNLSFPIEAGTRLKVEFQGTRAFSGSMLRSLLLFKDERSYDEHVIDASADRIRSHYESNGYPYAEARWTWKEIPDEDGILVQYSVDEGPLVCLRSLTTQGNGYFSTRRLLKESAARPGWNPIPCNPLNPKLLEEDLARIRILYSDEGFHEASVEQKVSLPPDVQEAARARAAVVLVITEGIQTRIEDVMIIGNESVPSKELFNRIRLRSGTPYNKDRVRENADLLRQFYSEKGFMYARISVEEVFSDDRSAVRLTFRVDEEHQVRIGRILLEGNTFTQEYVIRRELKTQSGDPYNEKKIQLSRHRLLKLGFLRDIRFRPIKPLSLDKKENSKDMLLSVRERPPKSLEFGFGYGEFERLRGFIQVSHVNLAGTGRALTLRGEASSKERKSTVSYLEPWLLKLDVDGRVTGLVQTLIRPAYDLTAIGASAGIEKDLTESLKGSFVYQIEFNNFTNVELDEEDQGRVNIATLNPSLIFDSRDDPFDPKSGNLSGIAFRLGAKNLGSQVQLRKATAQSHWFFPLRRWLVLAVSARGGIAEKFGASDAVPPSERFFAGGRTTVRGYDQDELGIVGSTISSETGGPTGGKVVLIGNIELRFSLPAGFGLVLFNDRGNVWFSAAEKVNLQDIKLNELKSTVGAGLRYNTPVGPLRFDVGYKLDREDNLCPECSEPIEETHYELHFTLGHAF